MPHHNIEQITRWIETACLWEVAAPKAGNVHPQASFSDLTHNDFVRSARITAFMLARSHRGVGRAILDTSKAVRLQVGKNTNLGIILLLAPLLTAAQEGPIEASISDVIDRMTVEDSKQVYEAIRTARPGGMGEVANQDVSQEPTAPIREIMQLAADRDLIARQYANSFADVLGFGSERLQQWWTRCPESRETAIIGLHLDWMANYPDSLIERKCGRATAEEVSRKASALLEAGWPEAPESAEAFTEFDTWLRSDGNRLNPGTSADLVAACLFVGLCEDTIR
ncbi:triphosphoribosyl-dephospho-CoA synthase [Rubinisphaera margarita]|uniref:triphosphoribosyl-dephospho-CoA synthase n=1 Tax=Rubinisphaera margarita TaxID=2909586 RepID=UPI001EE7C5C8|nr:triphosphoribosyl-dephospho-CoA synthase [Rubinisphaera margarita]MCG6154284.1 triphosphoribosyl-dephospho-CoA synthase [Rubinisphaera margarita]